MSEPFIRFSQSAGTFDFYASEEAQPVRLGTGWAGHGDGKNNPAMQQVHNVGPLPRGKYTISPPFTHPHCGPFALRLNPLPDTVMYGRDGFLIHGPAQDPAHYGQESNGCAILARVDRERLYATGARIFDVVE